MLLRHNKQWHRGRIDILDPVLRRTSADWCNLMPSIHFHSLIEEFHMQDVVIVAAGRTAVGKFGGSLAKVPAADLGACDQSFAGENGLEWSCSQ